MKRTSIVLADDHTVVRECMRILLNSQADLEVVGEASTGQEAVLRVTETGARVLCLDLSMPGWGGLTTIEQIGQASSKTRILILTMHNDPAYARTMINAGASGFVLKSSPTKDLLAAIRAVAVGDQFIESSIQNALEVSSQPSGLAQLSRREREVLELLSHGHTHQEIADRLFVSVKTVETYRARLRSKTGLKTRADFVRYSLDTKIFDSQSNS